MAPAKPALERVVSRALLVAVAALAFYLLFMSLPWPLIHDAPIMHYVAWRGGNGAVPYRDIFDMNQPGVYLIHLGVLGALGDGDFPWRLFDLAVLGLSALAVAAFARVWGSTAAVGGALVFVVYHLAGGAWQAGQRDFLLCPLLLGGALGVVRWIEGAQHTRAEGAQHTRVTNLVWGGLLLGAGITIKPHTGLFVVALAVAIVLITRGRRAGLKPLATFLVGVVLPPAIVLGWLVAIGAFGAWRDVTFGYLVPLYARLGWPPAWTFDRWYVWIPLAAAVGLSLGSALSRGRFSARHAVATIGLAYGVVHFFGQGKGWEYHLHPLAAFTSVLLFCELEAVLQERRAAVAAPLVASLVAVIVLLGFKGVEASDAVWAWDKERVVRILVNDLSERGLRRGDQVQVLDTTDGGIHALFRLRVTEPTRFLYDFHFFHDVEQPMIARLRAEFAGELGAHPPRFVVVFQRGWPTGRYDRLDRFPEIVRLLERSYTMIQRRPWYQIFAKRDDS